MSEYTVKTWNARTGRMEERLSTFLLERATEKAQELRREGEMPFVYDQAGRSIYVPRPR